MNKKIVYSLTLALSISLASGVLAANINKERNSRQDKAKISIVEVNKDENALNSLSEDEIKNHIQNTWDFIIYSAVGRNSDILKQHKEVIINNKYYYELKEEYSTREGLLRLLNKNFSVEYSDKLVDSLFYENINGKYYIVIGESGVAFKLSKSKIIDKKVQDNKLYVTWSGYSDGDEEYSPKKAVLKYEDGKVVVDYYQELSELGNVAR